MGVDGGGAALGAAFGLLFDEVRKVIKNNMMFKPSLKSLMATLEILEPLMEEVRQLNDVLSRRKRETEYYRGLIEEGTEHVVKCSKVGRYNVFKKWYYFDKLLELDQTLKSLILSVSTAKDSKETLIKVDKILALLTAFSSSPSSSSGNSYEILDLLRKIVAMVQRGQGVSDVESGQVMSMLSSNPEKPKQPEKPKEPEKPKPPKPKPEWDMFNLAELAKLPETKLQRMSKASEKPMEPEKAEQVMTRHPGKPRLPEKPLPLPPPYRSQIKFHKCSEPKLEDMSKASEKPMEPEKPKPKPEKAEQDMSKHPEKAKPLPPPYPSQTKFYINDNAEEHVGVDGLRQAFRLLFDAVKEYKDKAGKFKPILVKMEAKLQVLEQMMIQMEEIHDKEEVEDVKLEMENGEELVRNCPNISVFKRHYYSNKLHRLDESLCRLFQILQVQAARDSKKNLDLLHQIQDKINGD